MPIYDDAYLTRLMEKPEGSGPHDPLPGKLAQMLLMQREITRSLELQLSEARKLVEDELREEREIHYEPNIPRISNCGIVETLEEILKKWPGEKHNKEKQ